MDHASYEEIREIISNGKLNMITSAVQETLKKGISSDEILDCMIKTMGEVGEKFQNNDIYVPDMLISAKTMERGVSVLKTTIPMMNTGKYGLIIMGTVAGDLHDIGKNLVSIMLQSAGFNVLDLGIDVSAEDFIKAIKEHPECKVVALSALLSYTLPSMTEIVTAIRKTAAGKKVKIMVGGAPVNADFAKEIGADGYSANAVDAVQVAKSFITQ